MKYDTKAHALLASLMVILLWSTSLSASKHLATFLVFSSSSSEWRIHSFQDEDSDATTFSSRNSSFKLSENSDGDAHTVRQATTRFLRVLMEEASRFNQCVQRQNHECLVTIQKESIQSKSVFETNLASFKREATDVHLAIDVCSIQLEQECALKLNQSDSARQELLNQRESRARQRLLSLEEASRRQQLALDAVWAAVECTRPRGRCKPTVKSNAELSISDQFTQAMEFLKDSHEFDLKQLESHNARIRQRLGEAETFIQSVRAVSDHLAAVGIHLGVPKPMPPLGDFSLSSFPALASAEEMFRSAVEPELARVRERQAEAERAMNGVLSEQRAEIHRIRDDALSSLNSSFNQTKNRLDESLEAIRNHRLYTGGPGTLALSNGTMATALERLEVFDTIWNEISSLGDLAIAFDYLYRTFRTVSILARAVRTTRQDAKYVYDGTPLLTDSAIPLSSSSWALGTVWTHFRREFNPSTVLAATLTASLASLSLNRLYLPFWENFKRECHPAAASSTTTTTSSAIARNLETIARTWTAAEGRAQQGRNAVDLQSTASQVCLNESFAANEQVHAVDKAVRDHLSDARASESANCIASSGTTCLDDIQWPSNTSLLVQANGTNYDCSRLLEGCEASCQGPSNDVLTRASIAFTCDVEGIAHHSIRVVVIAVVVFVFTNLASVLLVRGLIRLWMSMRFFNDDDDDQNDDLRSIIWHCNVTKGELLSLKSFMPRDSLKRFFAERDSQDRQTGWLLIMWSALAHLLWIAVVFSVLL